MNDERKNFPQSEKTTRRNNYQQLQTDNVYTYDVKNSDGRDLLLTCISRTTFGRTKISLWGKRRTGDLPFSGQHILKENETRWKI